MEKKQRTLNNEGFSLIELIVVIAIMAILVGVLAPNVIRYVNQSRTSADVQLADTVKSAIEVALIDPSVTDSPLGTVTNLDFSDDTTFSANFGQMIATTLGYANIAGMVAATGVDAQISTTGTTRNITATISAAGQVSVTVTVDGTAVAQVP